MGEHNVARGRRVDSRKLNLNQMISRTSTITDQRNSNYQSSNRYRNYPQLQQHHHNKRNMATSNYRDPGIAHKFSKQQFLQANCQFVVLNGHDYSIHRVDPDWPVDWDCIEEIKFNQCASSETTCPICLETPKAAKITKCGHIYCWTCMLHYLSLSDEKCRQCPICFEFVYKNDLRSVVSHSYISYTVECEIEMKLMVRRKGCVTVDPYITLDTLNSTTNEESDLTEAQKQSLLLNCYRSQENLFIVDAKTVISRVVERERSELRKKLATDMNQPETCFIEQALSLLNEREDDLRKNDRRSIVFDSQSPSNDKQPGRKIGNNHNNLDLSSSYLFYQSSDGQHIYLNPFSTKILCYEYETLENCPPEIRANILQMDWISMSDAWRKRFRYLSHLPLTCEFRLIEIDFERSPGNNLISEKTFKLFEEQIRSREMVRERQRREERKREKIIRVEQDRKIYGIQPSLKININNPDQFPSVSDERYIGLSLTTTDHSPRDEAFSDSSYDDNEANDNQQDPHSTGLTQMNHDEINSQLTADANDDVMVSKVALSFAEIQLEEEAAASKSFKTLERQAVGPGHWATQSPQSSKQHQPQQTSNSSGASFAQLLVNAKASKQCWTIKQPQNLNHNDGNNFPNLGLVNVGSHRNRFEGVSQQVHGLNDPCNDPDDDNQEELRAPGNFTLNDFIDTQLVSTSTSGKKSRAKQQSKSNNTRTTSRK